MMWCAEDETCYESHPCNGYKVTATTLAFVEL